MVIRQLEHRYSSLSIRSKLLLVLMLMIIGVSLISVFSLQKSYDFVERSNAYNNLYSEIGKLKQYNDQMYFHLSRFIDTVQNEHLVAYNEVNDKYYAAIQEVNQALVGQEQYVFLLRAINNAHQYIGINGNMAIRLRLHGDADYYSYYYKTLRVNQYIKTYFDELLQESLKNGEALKSELTVEAESLQRRTLASVILVGSFFLWFALMFADYITEYINEIVRLTSEIAKGNLHVRGRVSHAKDEVGEMTRSFDQMSERMRNMIEGLKERQAIERKLHEEEVKNITMQNRLNDARFIALQSQINPHFLFNTINIISRMAMFEKAKKTDSLIQSLAHILRYSLRTRGKEVSFKNELDVVEQYMRIQRYRFGDRVRYNSRGITEEVASDLKLPPFTLQPIVENAIIHGIEPKVEGGEIRIRLIQQDGFWVVRLIDNGMGMEKEQLEAIVKANDASGKSIGVRNVAERLDLYFGRVGSVKVWSKKGMGTIVSIRLGQIS